MASPLSPIVDHIDLDDLESTRIASTYILILIRERYNNSNTT